VGDGSRFVRSSSCFRPTRASWLIGQKNRAALHCLPVRFSTLTKIKWKQNALRHSFISYRVADIQNVAQVALEAGNSPRIIFSNYRELLRPADAKTWFSISPEKQGDVIHLQPKKTKAA
jgi:hypothetical protein